MPSAVARRYLREASASNLSAYIMRPAFSSASFDFKSSDFKSSDFENFDADETWLAPGGRVLVAVSSGADSLALLCWLLHIKRELVVGHVNHALHELRPGACQADEDFVRARCLELKVPFAAVTVDLPRRNGHVNESVAREARYQSLAQMAREHDCAVVATAHTATDGLETALLNLMRGGGPQGWLGAPPRRVLHGDSRGEVVLVRPLWRVPRAATRDLLRARGWDWREDASNLDAAFRRNRVRAELLPLMSEICGRDADAIALGHARGAELARDENAFLDKLARAELSRCVLKSAPDALVLCAQKWLALDAALQRRVLRLATRQIAPALRDLSAAKVEIVHLSVAQQRKRAVWSWPHGVRVEWTGAASGNRVRLWRVGNEANSGTSPARSAPI